MIETFNSGSQLVPAKGQKKIDIQGFTCDEILVAGKFSDTISAYVSSQIILDPTIKDFYPLVTQEQGEAMMKDLLAKMMAMPTKARKN